MITGVVTPELEPRIQLTVRGKGARKEIIDAVVDTGFNGYLTLPSDMIAALQIPQVGHARVGFADGSESLCPLHRARVVWIGRLVSVEAEAADTDPLIGMALLEDHDLQIRVMSGGRVSIQAIEP